MSIFNHYNCEDGLADMTKHNLKDHKLHSQKKSKQALLGSSFQIILFFVSLAPI